MLLSLIEQINGASRIGEGGVDRLDDIFEILCYLVVAESQPMPTVVDEPLVTGAITVGVDVTIAIALNVKPVRAAGEVGKEWSDRVFSSESSAELVCTESAPQQTGRVGWLFPVRACVANESLLLFHG